MQESNTLPSSGAARATEPKGMSANDLTVAVMPQCPNCGWHDVRLSMTRGALDHALSAFSLIPFRCRTCGHRFYRFFKRASGS